MRGIYKAFSLCLILLTPTLSATAEVQDVLNAANAGAVCRPALPYYLHPCRRGGNTDARMLAPSPLATLVPKLRLGNAIFGSSCFLH